MEAGSGQSDLHRIIGFVEDHIKKSGKPISLSEIVQIVERSLGGSKIPEALVEFVLRNSSGRFVQTPDGCWELRPDPGKSETHTPSTGYPQPPVRPLTPNQAFDHIRDSAVEYLETAYKIAHPAVFKERGRILRTPGTIAQVPFIEATPAFPTGRKLKELEHTYPELIPPGLTELVQHGVPVDRFPLYAHQEEALLAAFSEQPNLLVATGTGSGKTEAFLLPILADLLREAYNWQPVSGVEAIGKFSEASQEWLHCRRHENRPAAIRAIILYPLNALVNDQLQRLRRILVRGESPQWQRQKLRGNLLRFGMYTSQSKPTGSPNNPSKRQEWLRHYASLRVEWDELSDELRETGGWPCPDGPEMLCRWDMQLAPPDILITNYSMLEYMLARPIEASIFDLTRRWLKEDEGARLTLVLDEAHTYTGAKGTEVAHLIRRLKERLGIGRGSSKFRAIATSASLPNSPGADEKLRQFTANLFDEPEERFTLVRVKASAPISKREADNHGMLAFKRFYDSFDAHDPWPAIDQLAQDLNLGEVDHSATPQEALYRLLEHDQTVNWVRSRTARNATMLDQLAKECWPGEANAENRERATAGVLAAGSFARADPRADAPPLLSTRIHGFFRGIPGLWACMDPNCLAVAPEDRSEDRPVGKLYTDPRPWCTCGARVLELFSCRHCGLLFLGGIPDSETHSLWPWSSDLSEEKQDYRDFEIFGVERPDPSAPVEYRSTRTTLHVHPEDVYARPTFEVEPATLDGQIVSPFPEKCPRCQHYRVPKSFGEGREVIEPLGTRGSRTFSVIIEEGFRVQGRVPGHVRPNYGRKVLVFSDSRRDAARLAAQLRRDHSDDVFRQLLYRTLHSCRDCGGTGKIEGWTSYTTGLTQDTESMTCSTCKGTGECHEPEPLSYAELRRRVLDQEVTLRINPDIDDDFSFFEKIDNNDQAWVEWAEKKFIVALRRELAEEQFSLEPLALARWRVQLPDQLPNDLPHVDKLTEVETRALIQAATRLLATEKVLLPPDPYLPWDWPDDVRPEDRCLLVLDFARTGNYIPFNLESKRRLGKYVNAISREMVRLGRLADENLAAKWVRSLRKPLWDTLIRLGILVPAGRRTANGKVPFGIRIDRFTLYPIDSIVHQCKECRYVMGDTLFGVCLRCGQQTEPIEITEVQNFYRRAAFYALPNSQFDDPFPLHANEHSAQISGEESRNLERWFQDFFREEENPDDKRVDVLSVTTTMEMGVDIGSLLCVGMRNVPPTVANYQQRAGRAGRRGSAVATVLTFAQQRSHDQYYFHRLPEIVSHPPRVPALHLDNDVIARRHVRALVLQTFFNRRIGNTSGLFESWGSIEQFESIGGTAYLREFISQQEDTLIKRCRKIVSPTFHGDIQEWISLLPREVDNALVAYDRNAGILEALISSGLLPRYAFPIDVVSLAIPNTRDWDERILERSEFSTDFLQRDRKIALAEYAPGSQVIRGTHPGTYVYTSVGVYDPFDRNPNYRPQGKLVECRDCQATYLVNIDDPVEHCRECGSDNLAPPLPYLRPQGFTVDGAKPDGGRRRYERGDDERGGYVAPAQLLAGQSSFAAGTSTAFAPNLYTHVKIGDLFVCNKGPDHRHPGFLICPSCGRALDPDNPSSHRRPSDVPPHTGRRTGPRAGWRCPNENDFSNWVILGHHFRSEVLLLGVDLPDEMDAPLPAPSGKAVWYSFGTLVANAAARTLQIDPSELKTGVRSVRRGRGRLHGEVFLYDDVPGGAGYARAIQANLEEILQCALDLGHNCDNPDCSGACYHCLLDYRNQNVHRFLDRQLGVAVLEFLLQGTRPSLEQEQIDQCAAALLEYVKNGWRVEPGGVFDGRYIPRILERSEERIALWVIHPLEAPPSPQLREQFITRYGLRLAVHTSFDLQRRPFWVMNNLVR